MHPQFPHGVAATGTPGIATLVEKIPGAIGYASSGYSVAYSLQRAEIRNAAGNFTPPHGGEHSRSRPRSVGHRHHDY